MISLNCELCLAPPGWAVAWLGCCLLDTQVVNVMMKPDFSPSFLHPLLAGVQLAARGNICCYEPIWRLSPPSPNMRHFTQLSHISSIARRNEMGNFLAPWPRLSPRTGSSLGPATFLFPQRRWTTCKIWSKYVLQIQDFISSSRFPHDQWYRFVSRVLLSSAVCDRGTTQPVGSCLGPVSTVSVIAAISRGGRARGRGTGAGGGPPRPATDAATHLHLP